ncbi:hypothetical protein [Streptomyces xanthochromogenes]|uniref:hypothetical protein n=1 Tax=Streptomyces xanthochromogenes TaxID=67384 RepID=UPI002F3E4AF0
MTDIGIPPRSPQDWDVPLPRLAADVKALVARQRLADGRAAEAHHLVDACDPIFATLAVAHPEACSTCADYPDWSAAMDARIATERTRGGAS